MKLRPNCVRFRPAPLFIADAIAAGGTSVTIPAGSIAGNDVLLCFCETLNTDSLSTPSGWTAITNITDSTVRVWAFYKVVAGGESSPSFGAGPFDHFLAINCLYRFCNVSASPIDVSATNAAGSAGTTATIPTLTTTGLNRLVVAGVGNDRDTPVSGNYSGWTHSALIGFAERDDIATSTNAGGTLGVADGWCPATGATGTGSVTMATSQRNACIAVALKPLV